MTGAHAGKGVKPYICIILFSKGVKPYICIILFIHSRLFSLASW